MSPIDTTILFAYMAMIIGLGVYANRKQQGVDDYFVAGRRIEGEQGTVARVEQGARDVPLAQVGGHLVRPGAIGICRKRTPGVIAKYHLPAPKSGL